MWMSEVAAAWTMTSLSDAPVMVALVQTFAALPIFLFGLPGGAIADIADRRSLLMVTQVWAAVVALALWLASGTGALTPLSLLLLVFANGIVLAMRWPVYSAIVPGLVPRRELAVAMALSGIANHGSRIAGPLAAGAIIAAAGPTWVFALNAVLAMVSFALLIAWRYRPVATTLPAERFASAMRVGIQHIRQSRAFKRVLLRCAAFFMHSIALIALLPLAARGLGDGAGGAGTYTLLLAGVGAGAVIGGFLIPMITRRMVLDRRVTLGTWLFASATAVMAFAPNLFVALPATVVAGIAFMFAANSLMICAQAALPDWVRARGLAVYQMVMMGGSALGAAIWGQIASMTSVPTSLLIAAFAGVAGVLIARKAPLAIVHEDETAPARLWTLPFTDAPVEPQVGPILATVEFRIDPARLTEFLDVMRESRRTWLASGLLAWDLYQDLADDTRYIEHLVDESWAAHLRRHDRVAGVYAELRERKHAFHLGPGAPVVRRYAARPVPL